MKELKTTVEYTKKLDRIEKFLIWMNISTWNFIK